MAKKGYHKCTACTKPLISERSRKSRLQFANEHKDWTLEDWKKIYWSDECTFTTGKRNLFLHRIILIQSIGKRRKSKVIRMSQECYCPDCIQWRYRSGRTSFSVWACIGWNFKSELVFLECHGAGGGANKDDYIEQVSY